MPAGCRNTGVEGAQEAFRAVSEAYEVLQISATPPCNCTSHLHHHRCCLHCHAQGLKLPLRCCRSCGTSTRGRRTMRSAEGLAAAVALAWAAQQPPHPERGAPAQQTLTRRSQAGLSGRGARPAAQFLHFAVLLCMPLASMHNHEYGIMGAGLQGTWRRRSTSRSSRSGVRRSAWPGQRRGRPKRRRLRPTGCEPCVGACSKGAHQCRQTLNPAMRGPGICAGAL